MKHSKNAIDKSKIDKIYTDRHYKIIIIKKNNRQEIKKEYIGRYIIYIINKEIYKRWLAIKKNLNKNKHKIR